MGRPRSATRYAIAVANGCAIYNKIYCSSSTQSLIAQLVEHCIAEIMGSNPVQA